MIRVGIIGASGYTGAELVKLIAGHPRAELAAVTSRNYAGRKFSDIFPAMASLVDVELEEMDIASLAKRVDCVFLALPHKVSMAHAPDFIKKGIKVIDLSADFRFKNEKAYEKAYQPHLASELLKRAVYGLSEHYPKELAKADLVGNPGCYPTSFLLPVLPMIKEGLIETKGIVSDSKSGVSGAGRSLSLTTHFCEANESFKPYKVGSHRHVPEMEEILTIHAKKSVKITFVPHLLPLTRGMLTTVYSTIKNGVTENKIRKVFDTYYGDKPFVRILENGRFPDVSHVRGTNFCDIGLFVDPDSNRLVLVNVSTGRNHGTAVFPRRVVLNPAILNFDW